MVLRLYLIRHGKSSWADESLDDLDRPLKKRGKKDCKLMKQRLAAVAFDALLSSPARRARETCERVAGRPADAIVDDFYFEGFDAVLRGLQDALGETDHKTVAAFGHNPDWSEFLARCGHGNDDYEMPTCAVAIIQWDDCNSWSELSFETARVMQIITPKHLKQEG